MRRIPGNLVIFEPKSLEFDPIYFGTQDQNPDEFALYIADCGESRGLQGLSPPSDRCLDENKKLAAHSNSSWFEQQRRELNEEESMAARGGNRELSCSTESEFDAETVNHHVDFWNFDS